MFLYNGTATSKEFTRLYSTWACVLVLQLLCFTWFTGRVRVRTEMIHSDEDRMWMKNPTLCPTGGGHPEVDHIRAGHLNDLALILIHLIIALVWLNASPNFVMAAVLLRAFPIAKILHSILYMRIIEAPKILRTICLAICYASLVCMSVSSAYYFYS